MIVYMLKDGFALDARFERDDYQPRSGEYSIPGCDIPPLDTLHDPAAVAAKQERDAVRAKIAALESPTGFTRKQREWVIANGDAGKLRDALASVEASIATEREKLRK